MINTFEEFDKMTMESPNKVRRKPSAESELQQKLNYALEEAPKNQSITLESNYQSIPKKSNC